MVRTNELNARIPKITAPVQFELPWTLLFPGRPPGEDDRLGSTPEPILGELPILEQCFTRIPGLKRSNSLLSGRNERNHPSALRNQRNKCREDNGNKSHVNSSGPSD